MAAKQIGSLIKGLLFQEGSKLANSAINKFYDWAVPDKFPDGFTKFQDGNRQKDNWGTFGTFVAKTAYDVLTAPLNQTNSALPPTEGTVVEFAPALPSQPPIRMVHTEQRPVQSPVGQAGSNPREESLPIRGVRRPIRRRVIRRRTPVKKTSTRRRKSVRKNVAEEMVPKRKKKYTYRVNI